MLCPRCGTENPEDARFCMKCANRLLPTCAEGGQGLVPDQEMTETEEDHTQERDPVLERATDILLGSQ